MSGPCESCGGAWGADTPTCPYCGGKERPPCPKCGLYGGTVVEFVGLCRHIHSSVRWVCPHCMDRDKKELALLRRGQKAWKEIQESIAEFMGDWT